MSLQLVVDMSLSVKWVAELLPESSIMTSETLILITFFTAGALAGLLSRWGPLSGWLALAFPILLPPAGIGLSAMFC